MVYKSPNNKYFLYHMDVCSFLSFPFTTIGGFICSHKVVLILSFVISQTTENVEKAFVTVQVWEEQTKKLFKKNKIVKV